MDRRKFLSLSAIGMANLALCDQLALAKPVYNVGKSNYNVVILGDTHYDTEPASVFHSKYVDPNEKSNALHRSEFVRNGEMWRERCPKMLKRASKLVDDDTKFILQMGDLIQGDCGDPEIHKKMLTQAVNLIKTQVSSELPFVTVVGNHDIRGTKAKEAYHEFMPKVMTKELGCSVKRTSFCFYVNDDVYIVIDFNDPEPDVFDKMLADSKGARHTFIVSHGTVFPAVGSYPRWYLFGGQKSPENPALLKHFLTEFAKRNAIVFAGHIHMTELFDWYGYGGHITQLAMNSVWAKEEYGEYKVLREGPEHYDLLSSSEKARKAGPPELFAPYRPGLKRYSLSNAAGSYKLNVSDESITVDFYAGNSKARSHQFILR